MPSIKTWLRYFLIVFLHAIPVLFVSAVSFSLYWNLELECGASNALQRELRERLSKTELLSVRPDSGVCPTLFFYMNDDGVGGCASSGANIFRGPEISFGSCG